MDSDFPSPIVMKHPSGLVKEFSLKGSIFYSIIFGPFYFMYLGLWKFIFMLIAYVAFLIGAIMIDPKSNVTVLIAIGQPIFYLWLAYSSYEEKCKILYNRGFRDFDARGEPINRN